MSDVAFAEILIGYAAQRMQTRPGAVSYYGDCRAALLTTREALQFGCEWDELAADALDDNPFFDRRFVAASLDCLKSRQSDRVLALHLRSNRKLVGLVPFRQVRLAGHARSPLNIYQFNGAPLISRAHAEAAVEAFLAIAHGRNGSPRRWVFPHVQLDGCFANLLRQKAASHGMRVEQARTYDRPILTRKAGSFETHAREIIGKKRAKSLQKNLEKLSEQGKVCFERASDVPTVTRRIEDFLRIEHAGWKGLRGTSFLAKPQDAAFARRAFAGAEGGLTTVDSLLLDGQPIAISINIGAGHTLFTPKCAYDENYRKLSPGLILEYLIVQAFHSGQHDLMNAATTDGGHVIAGMWDASIPMGSLIVGPKGTATRSLAFVEDAERRCRKFTKRILRRS